MNALRGSYIGLIATLALSGAVYGQVPASNDTSDGKANTGMGTGALGGPITSNQGNYNTASGYGALQSNTNGSGNTASGFEALLSNTTGSDNTASGQWALLGNTTGWSNVASGVDALYVNTTGSNNTASGANALYSSMTGSDNTATGNSALYSNTTGEANTASGMGALSSASDGTENTADGFYAMHNGLSGNYNAAFGSGALYGAAGANGSANTGVGATALHSYSTGNNNTALGASALYNNSTGSANIALGYEAGYNIKGSNNIDIGNEGTAADIAVIRIGSPGLHKEVLIAGIEASKITGSAVYVTATGRLGVLASSERYKTAIEPMGSNTAKLERLRPVTFHLKTDPKGALQYGLIAEEVAKVYPELVIRDEKGRIEGVRYDELAPMLLNEVQNQQAKIAEQASRLAELEGLKQQVAALVKANESMHAAIVKIQSKDRLAASR